LEIIKKDDTYWEKKKGKRKKEKGKRKKGKEKKKKKKNVLYMDITAIGLYCNPDLKSEKKL
jgi:hypothetical protein